MQTPTVAIRPGNIIAAEKIALLNRDATEDFAITSLVTLKKELEIGLESFSDSSKAERKAAFDKFLEMFAADEPKTLLFRAALYAQHVLKGQDPFIANPLQEFADTTLKSSISTAEEAINYSSAGFNICQTLNKYLADVTGKNVTNISADDIADAAQPLIALCHISTPAQLAKSIQKIYNIQASLTRPDYETQFPDNRDIKIMSSPPTGNELLAHKSKYILVIPTINVDASSHAAPPANDNQLYYIDSNSLLNRVNIENYPLLQTKLTTLNNENPLTTETTISLTAQQVNKVIRDNGRHTPTYIDYEQNKTFYSTTLLLAMQKSLSLEYILPRPNTSASLPSIQDQIDTSRQLISYIQNLDLKPDDLSRDIVKSLSRIEYAEDREAYNFQYFTQLNQSLNNTMNRFTQSEQELIKKFQEATAAPALHNASLQLNLINKLEQTKGQYRNMFYRRTPDKYPEHAKAMLDFLKKTPMAPNWLDKLSQYLDNIPENKSRTAETKAIYLDVQQMVNAEKDRLKAAAAVNKLETTALETYSTFTKKGMELPEDSVIEGYQKLKDEYNKVATIANIPLTNFAMTLLSSTPHALYLEFRINAMNSNLITYQEKASSIMATLETASTSTDINKLIAQYNETLKAINLHTHSEGDLEPLETVKLNAETQLLQFQNSLLSAFDQKMDQIRTSMENIIEAMVSLESTTADLEKYTNTLTEQSKMILEYEKSINEISLCLPDNN
ncbi:MAG: hypothetical protein NTV32_10310, partial [Gammaproteobacteria bacterium]|nr:hypothetical protein [Gammaproteobacteria bacterium]